MEQKLQQNEVNCLLTIAVLTLICYLKLRLIPKSICTKEKEAKTRFQFVKNISNYVIFLLLPSYTLLYICRNFLTNSISGAQ